MLEDYEIKKVEEKSEIVRIESPDRADVDAQVATAKQYPRDVTRSVNNSIAMATIDEATAQTMGYALPRGGKPITGPSVNLAKLLVSNWGNIRAEARVTQITDKQVISRGTCWDLENNVAVSFEVRRSIRTKAGMRFSDDMITVVGNAANAIAYRNAVFAVIPKAVTDKVYKAAQEYITGDLSDETKILQRRTKCIKFFADEYGITEDEVVKLVGKQTVNQIRADEIALLLGITNSLRDGDTTVDDLMKPIRGERHDTSKETVNPAKGLFSDAEEVKATESTGDTKRSKKA